MGCLAKMRKSYILETLPGRTLRRGARKPL
jgi:hypothetical protein